MKAKTILSMSFISAILLLVVVSCNRDKTLTFPFSQFVVSVGRASNVWKYDTYLDIDENENIIAPPKSGEDWNAWYTEMKDYQKYLRENVNDPTKLRLQISLNSNSIARLNFKRVLNSYTLNANDKLSMNGFIKGVGQLGQASLSLMYIRKGKELSYEVIEEVVLDSMSFGEDWSRVSINFTIPDFDVETLIVQPILLVKTNGEENSEVFIKELELSIPATAENKATYENQKSILFAETKGADNQVYERPELDWITSNFIYNFVMLWDKDLWDHEKKVFTVDNYCEKMNREFGGVQSVLLWFCYPNIGLDDQNTWDFVDAIPGGGIDGLKKVVSEFHKNGVKVFFSYTPWDIDTKRSEYSDAENWAKTIDSVDGDGLFFDTWSNVENFRDELDKYKKGISIHTEGRPSLQNIQTYYAVTSSWGQKLAKYDNNGISRMKWFNPEHIQWTISRWTQDRQNDLAYTWINGQGLVLWENIFGTLNFWNAKDRSDFRKMNAIYQQFAHIYTSDTWKPYLPSENPDVHVSSWENNEYRLWNIITDKEGITENMTLQVDDENMNYFNLWTGEKLKVEGSKVTIPINRLSSVIGMKNAPTKQVIQLLNKQKAETAKILPAIDPYMTQQSTKKAKLPPKINYEIKVRHNNLLNIPKGKYHLETSHVRREGDCFPNANATHNNDLVIKRNIIFHDEKVNLPSLNIMPRVVTNKEFGNFLTATNYEPRIKYNFLRHWNGSRTCPEGIENEPVVFVTLDDARAYGKWAGMRLPTEWEWQAAGELYPNDFVFNEVWEWNESERTDGNNVFVTLRGGAKDWILTTSHWYFPGVRNLWRDSVGGEQPLDSHCKYYIMKAGFDRAGTLGFRCIK